MKVKTRKIKEKCPHCGAKWKGDGWTKTCPNCGKPLMGNWALPEGGGARE